MSQKKTKRSNDEWRLKLTPEEYHVLRENGTERPFTNAYWKSNESGEYYCAGCDTLLFTSLDKFFSECGWPAFTQPATDQVTLHQDKSNGIERIEVRCGTCDGHLGHVFDDGPEPLNARYCINSVSLRFQTDKQQ